MRMLAQVPRRPRHRLRCQRRRRNELASLLGVDPLQLDRRHALEVLVDEGEIMRPAVERHLPGHRIAARGLQGEEAVDEQLRAALRRQPEPLHTRRRNLERSPPDHPLGSSRLLQHLGQHVGRNGAAPR